MKISATKKCALNRVSEVFIFINIPAINVTECKSREKTHLARAGSGIAWIKADIELLNREPENLTPLKDAI